MGKRTYLIVIVVLIVIAPYWAFSIFSKKPLSQDHNYRIIPEYNRRLKTVAISVDRDHPSLKLHSGLIAVLPEYTKVLLLLPKDTEDEMSEQIKNWGFESKVETVGFETEYIHDANVYLLFTDKKKFVSAPLNDVLMPRGSLWAQDLFEPALSSEGRPNLLISDLHKSFLLKKGDDPGHVVRDNAFIGALRSAEMDVERLPVTFMGGNLMIDILNGRSIAFCGGDVLLQTKTVWKSTKERVPSDEEIISMIKRHLNVDDVVVIGGENEQPALLFHLDQAMTLLPDGVALITEVLQSDNDVSETDEIKNVRTFLAELNSTMQKMGYRTEKIYTTVNNVLNYQYYINGIPFINDKTGQREFYMPIFTKAQSGTDSENIKKNIAVFEQYGYSVVTVPTKADNLHGGIHCLFNVIS